MNPSEQLQRRIERAKNNIIQEKQNFRVRIYCGDATCENAAGAKAVYTELRTLIDEQNLSDVYVGLTGCSGRCDREPIVQVITDTHPPTLYADMNPDKIRKVVKQHILGKTIITEWTL